jgi:hypothetical protein
LDEEVAEVMKRKKIARIQQLQQSLVQIVELKLGEENSEEIFGEKIDLPSSLAAAASFSTSLHTCDTDNGKEDDDLMQINYQLRKIPPVKSFSFTTLQTLIIIVVPICNLGHEDRNSSDS